MTKAKEALKECPICYFAVTKDGEPAGKVWLYKNRETIRKALELLDKVEQGGVDMQQINELQTLSDDEWDFINIKYIY